MSRFYSCCGGERAWSHNGHTTSCPYAVAASLKAHPVNQDNLRREIEKPLRVVEEKKP